MISLDALEHAIDATLRTTSTEWPDLYDALVLHSRRGRDGGGRLRAVLDERFGDQVITDSWFERVVRRLLLDVWFPVPESRWNVFDGLTFLGELDLAWPAARVGRGSGADAGEPGVADRGVAVQVVPVDPGGDLAPQPSAGRPARPGSYETGADLLGCDHEGVRAVQGVQ